MRVNLLAWALGSELRAWPLLAQEAAEESLKSLMITTDDEGDGGC